MLFLVQGAKHGEELRAHLFYGVLKLHANGVDLSLFLGFRKGMDDSGREFPPQLDLPLLSLKGKDDESMLGWDRTQPGNQRSTQGQIGNLSLDDMAVPVQGTGNGNLIPFKLAPLFHLQRVAL